MPEGDVQLIAAETPPVVETPTPSAPPAKPTWDEILASETPAAETPVEEETTEEAETLVEAAPEGSETKEVPEEEEAEDEEEEFLEPEPDEFKRAFKAHPKLKDAFYRDLAYKRAIGSVQEARAYKEIAPTLEDLQMLQSHAEGLLQLDHLYTKEPHKFVEKLSVGNPNAFATLVSELRPTLHQLNRDLYKREVADPIIGDFFTNVGRFADKTQDVDLQAALEILSEKMGWTAQREREAGQSEHPAVAELEALKRREADTHRNAVYSFAARADQVLYGAINREVEASLSKLPAKGLLPGVKPVVVKQVSDDVWHALEANQYLSNIYNRQKFSGNVSEDHLTQLVSIRISQAKPLIGKRVAKMLKQITADTLADNKTKLKQAAESTQRKDAGNGSGQPAHTPPTGKVDYQRTTWDDILSGDSNRIKYKR